MDEDFKEIRLVLFWSEQEGCWKTEVTHYNPIEDDESENFNEYFLHVGDAATHLLNAKIAHEQWNLNRAKRVLDTERSELDAIELQTLLLRTQRSDLKDVKRKFQEALDQLKGILRSELR